MTERGPDPDPLRQAGEGARGRAALRHNVGFARMMRRDPTDVERRLWQALRAGNLGVRFRRQHQVGPYVVDFACLELTLVIELDGGQHSPEVDEKRTKFLESQGFEVLRFWNNDVTENFRGVVETIEMTLSRLREREGPAKREGEGSAEASTSRRNPHPDPLPQAGEGAQGERTTQ